MYIFCFRYNRWFVPQPCTTYIVLQLHIGVQASKIMGFVDLQKLNIKTVLALTPPPSGSSNWDVSWDTQEVSLLQDNYLNFPQFISLLDSRYSNRTRSLRFITLRTVYQLRAVFKTKLKLEKPSFILADFHVLPYISDSRYLPSPSPFTLFYDMEIYTRSRSSTCTTHRTTQVCSLSSVSKAT